MTQLNTPQFDTFDAIKQTIVVREYSCRATTRKAIVYPVNPLNGPVRVYVYVSVCQYGNIVVVDATHKHSAMYACLI
jgi:hypothetical protein